MYETASAPSEGLSVLRDLFTDPSLGSEVIEASRGDVLFEPLSAARWVFYLQHGQVRLYQITSSSEAKLLDILGPGQWFGCASLGEAEVYGMQAVAEGNSVITKIPAQRLAARVAQSPAAALEMIGDLADTLRNAREESARLAFQNCQQRLIEALIRFSQTAAASQHEDRVVLRITHQQLAKAIGVARETVSLTLTQMRQKNLVQTGRNQLTFSPDALRRFVDLVQNPVAHLAESN